MHPPKPLLLVALVLLVAQQVSSLQPSPRVDDGYKYANSYGSYKPEKGNKKAQAYDFGDKTEADDRIKLQEPYKSLIQTTARFVMAQTGLARHVDIETAIDVMNDTGYALSRPSILAKVLKSAVVALATLLATAFFFPNTYKFVDTAWRDPSKLLSRLGEYLPNGINERTITGLMGAKTDDFLSKIGLAESGCRELSVCQAGELMRCALPQTTETATKFIADHFSRPLYRENNYVNAFLSGLVEQNCAKFSPNETKQGHCFGDIFGSYFLSKCNIDKELASKHKKRSEFQTIQVGRA